MTWYIFKTFSGAFKREREEQERREKQEAIDRINLAAVEKLNLIRKNNSNRTDTFLGWLKYLKKENHGKSN